MIGNRSRISYFIGTGAEGEFDILEAAFLERGADLRSVCMCMRVRVALFHECVDVESGGQVRMQLREEMQAASRDSLASSGDGVRWGEGEHRCEGKVQIRVSFVPLYALSKVWGGKKASLLA
eukprot:4247750-Pleurochrysis_carterae.AAC.1